METKTFTALAERAGRWWTVRVPQIEGLAVQVRSLDQAEMMARRHICEALHLSPEAVRVEVRTEASVLPAVTKALQARQAAAQAAEAAARATRSAIEALLADGSTLQEAAIVLRLSPQEAADLASGARGPTGAPGASGGHGGPAGGHDSLAATVPPVLPVATVLPVAAVLPVATVLPVPILLPTATLFRAGPGPAVATASLPSARAACPSGRARLARPPCITSRVTGKSRWQDSFPPVG